MKMRRSIALSLMLLCSMGLIGGCGTKEKPVTVAEKYPDKPITLIVPFAAGGSTDLVARSMEKVFTKYLSQPLIVKNVPGGAATIGLNEIAGAEPDGYTLGIVSIGVMLQPLYGQTRYHYPSALDPLVQVTSLPTIAVVQADKPWNNIGDLINYAKQNPEKVKFGHPGLGSGNHVAGEMFGQIANISMDQVPFKGDSETLAALLGGHIQLIFTTLPSVKEHIKSGKVRVLGIAGEKRSTDSVLSSVPTFREQGIDMNFGIWQGIAVHKVMEPEVKAKLLSALEKVVNDPEYIQNMKALGMEIDYLGQKEFEEKWVSDTVRFRKIVQETGIAEKIAAQKN